MNPTDKMETQLAVDELQDGSAAVQLPDGEDNPQSSDLSSDHDNDSIDNNDDVETDAEREKIREARREERRLKKQLHREKSKESSSLINALKKQNKKAMQSVSTAAYAAREFITQYANQVAADVSEVRSAITTKLLALANCGDPKFELKAIELLGKHSDIALFTERSEITINHKSSADLEEAIKERVKRLLNADVVDVTPLMDDLDAELAATEEATFEEAEHAAMAVEDIDGELKKTEEPEGYDFTKKNR